jgi:hypothetical protein
MLRTCGTRRAVGVACRRRGLATSPKPAASKQIFPGVGGPERCHSIRIPQPPFVALPVHYNAHAGPRWENIAAPGQVKRMTDLAVDRASGSTVYTVDGAAAPAPSTLIP